MRKHRKTFSQTVSIDEAPADAFGRVPVSIYQPAGESVDISIQDQHTRIVNEPFVTDIQSVTLVSPVAVGDYSATISGVAPTDGNLIVLSEGFERMHAEILSHAANGANWDVSLDTPFDFAFTTAAVVQEASEDMAVNGSVTPAVFHLSPHDLDPSVRWDITTITGTILDTAAGADDSMFGALASLAKGIVVRMENSFIRNIFNIKTNGQFYDNGFDVEYISAAPSGDIGVRFKCKIGGHDNFGVTIRAGAADDIQIIVQDNLSGLNSFKMRGIGHYVED